MGMGGFIGQVNNTANHINPFKGITDWSTNHSLAYIPGVGKPLAQLANWGDSHPAQVGAAIGAAFGGAALLGGGAAGAGMAGGGLGAEGGMGALGGVGADAGMGGLGGVADAGMGGLGGADSMAAGGGGFNWQGLGRQLLSNQMKSNPSPQSATPYQQAQTDNSDQVGANRQRMALALMNLQKMQQSDNPAGQYSWAQGANQLSQAALAAYLRGRSK